MRRVAVLCVAVILAVSSPAAAGEPSAEQLALAERFLELSQGASVRDAFRREMEQSLGKSEMPDEQRQWLTANVTTTMMQVFERSVADIRDDVAALFTEEELRAAIAFQETPVGRSFADKSFELGSTLQRAMLPHMMEGMTRLSEKFCVRFSCETDGETSLGKSRN